MGCRNKNRIGRDTVHVNAGTSLNVIHMYVTVFGDEIDDVILRGDLHGHGEVVLCFGGEEDVHCFLEEGLVAGGRLADLCGNIATISGGSING